MYIADTMRANDLAAESMKDYYKFFSHYFHFSQIINYYKFTMGCYSSLNVAYLISQQVHHFYF